MQVASLNHRSGQSGGVSPIKLLTNILEKAALLNYKQIFSGLQGTCIVMYLLCNQQRKYTNLLLSP